MEKRDILKDQIEQLGKVLAKALSDFLRLKTEGKVQESITTNNQSLKNDLDIDINKLLALTGVELKTYLVQRNLTSEHIKILSEYLRESGTAEIINNAREDLIKLEKAIELIDIADEVSGTASFEGIDKKKEIQSLLQKHS